MFGQTVAKQKNLILSNILIFTLKFRNLFQYTARYSLLFKKKVYLPASNPFELP